MYRISRSARKYFLPVVGLVLISSSAFLSPAFAQVIQRIEIPSSLNPVGSGARALGMGGAFISVADDATAASWNPGGLIQLETPEVSIVGTYFSRTEDNSFASVPGASGKQNVSKNRLNYLSAAYPFALLGRNMVVSVNYQNLYDFTREWTFPLTQHSERLYARQDVDFTQKGGLSAFGIAYCTQITPAFSVGLTLNFWEDGIYKNTWEQTTRQTGSGTYMGNPFTFESSSHDQFSFSGFNVNLGVLWNLGSRVTLGAVFKTPFKADLRHESVFSSSVIFTANPSGNATPPVTSIEEEHLDMPMSYGLGVSYRFSDRFTASADIYRTEWGDFVLTDAAGRETSPITGKPVGQSDIAPTHQIRIGAEYLFINPGCVIPIRGGLFYDPAPAEGSPDDYFGFSLGLGIAYGRIVFDMAYQYRFGHDVGRSMLRNLGFSQDMEEHAVYSSIIVHF